MRQLWQRFTYLVSVMLFVMVSTITSMSPVYADHSNNNDKSSSTYYVCNYTGIPGQNEQLQGTGPQVVNSNEINNGNPVAVGTYYSQGKDGRSYVLAINNGQTPPACPAADDLTAIAPTFADLCGIANDTYTIPSETGVEYQINGNTVPAGTYTGTGVVTVTAVALAGYVLSGNTVSWTHSFTMTPCVVQVPATPAKNDPCGPNNATWDVPTNSSTVTWAIVNGDLIATTTPGNVFQGGSTTHNYGAAHDSNTPCVIALPTTPSQNDPCGPNNATWDVPTNSSTVTWAISWNGHLVATAATGYVFTDGFTTHDYGVAHDSNAPCVVLITPTVPTFNDVCGTDNDTYTVPSKTGVEYKVNGFPIWLAGTFPGFGTVTISAYAAYGYELNGTTTWSHTFTNNPCQAPCRHCNQPRSHCQKHHNTHCKHHQQQAQPQVAQPAAVTFTAPTCKNPLFGSFDVPTTPGVVYEDGNTVVSGDNNVSLPLAGSVIVTITAYPESSAYTLAGITSWAQTFTTPEGCGGGGQITPTAGGQGATPVTTVAAPVAAPTDPQQLTNTGVNVSVSSLIAFGLSLVAAGIMFGSRQRSDG